jgi:hypothetical protein
MPETFSIDLDAERVALDGAWYSRDDLAQKIKAMVDAGDYKLGHPSAALEALETALAELTSVSIKLPRSVLNALTGAANRSGKTVDALMREIVGRALAAPSPPSVSAAPGAMPLTTPAAAAPVALTNPKLVPGVPVLEPAPITLTPKKTPSQAPEPAGQAPAADADHNWFNRR